MGILAHQNADRRCFLVYETRGQQVAHPTAVGTTMTVIFLHSVFVLIFQAGANSVKMHGFYLSGSLNFILRNFKMIEAEKINQLNNLLDDLSARNGDIRRYL